MFRTTNRTPSPGKPLPVGRRRRLVPTVPARLAVGHERPIGPHCRRGQAANKRSAAERPLRQSALSLANRAPNGLFARSCADSRFQSFTPLGSKCPLREWKQAPSVSFHSSAVTSHARPVRYPASLPALDPAVIRVPTGPGRRSRPSGHLLAPLGHAEDFLDRRDAVQDLANAIVVKR